MSINLSFIIDNILLLPVYLFLATCSFEFYAIKYSATYEVIESFHNNLAAPLRWFFSNNSAYLKVAIYKRGEETLADHLKQTPLKTSRINQLMFFTACVVITILNFVNVFRGSSTIDAVVSAILALISASFTYVSFTFGKKLNNNE